MKLKNFIQKPLFRPALNIPGKILQSYFSSSSSKEQFRIRENRWNKIFPFLVNNNKSLKNPEIYARYEFILNYLIDGIALDVGCEDGTITHSISAKNLKVYGIDHIKRWNGQNNRNTFIQSYAEQLPFNDESFQNAIFSHSLEHILDFETALREAYRVLIPKGRIIVIVPKEKGNKPTHLRYFDKNSLLKNINQNFKIITYNESVGAGHGVVAEK